MNRFFVLHLLVLSSLAYLVSADEGSCVKMNIQDRCKACELEAGVNIVSWKNGINKCNNRQECCARSRAPISDIALKAYKNCQKNCNHICEGMGRSVNLYSATWPRLCLLSCKKMRESIFFGLFGAECPSDDEPCLKENFTLDLNRKDVPEVAECRKDPKSCSDCLISKTLPDYESKIARCQSMCSDMKRKKYGDQFLSNKQACTTHLYGQYIKFIEDSCSDSDDEKECTPDGGDFLTGGSCKSKNCEKEKEKCYEEAAPIVKDAAKIVASKWKISCEETCENATEEAVKECIAKGELRADEVESKLLSEMCSFLDSRS